METVRFDQTGSLWAGGFGRQKHAQNSTPGVVAFRRNRYTMAVSIEAGSALL